MDHRAGDRGGWRHELDLGHGPPPAAYPESHEGLRDLWQAFHVAQEMGTGVGGCEILQRPMPTHAEPYKARLVRLILGDQLVHDHPWFAQADDEVLHVMMEVRQETDAVVQHVQKILGFFAAMRRFADHLRAKGHRVLYLTLDDPSNL